MAFQKTVNDVMGGGVVGEIAFNSPVRAMPQILKSTTEINNVIGRAFQHVSGNDDDVTADLGSAGVFAGILINPKSHASLGTSAGTLEPTLQLPNETVVELLVEGDIIVDIDSQANIGDILFANFTTGVIRAEAPGTSTPANHFPIPGQVIRQNIPTAGLAYVHIGA